MTGVEYIQQWQDQQNARRAICARETQLVEVGQELLQAVAEIDPDAEERMRDLIAEVAGRHPMPIAA